MKILFLLKFLLVHIVLLGICLFSYRFLSEYKSSFVREEIVIQNKPVFFDEKAYDSCMAIPFQGINLSLRIDALKKEYQSYNLSFSFLDISNNYSFDFNGETIYYGASIIKLFEANYLLRESLNGHIDLQQTLVYKEQYKKKYSIEMQKHSIGDEISLYDLITYAISYSDNTAHEMLYDFIGIEKLYQYASMLGITSSINEWEHYGNLTSNDGLKILVDTYQLMNDNSFFQTFFSAIMNNEYYNSLNFANEQFFHKYGLTEPYYNDIGIHVDDPYLISIFTTYAYDDYKAIVGELSQKIYNIYKENMDAKKEYCLQTLA